MLMRSQRRASAPHSTSRGRGHRGVAESRPDPSDTNDPLTTQEQSVWIANAVNRLSAKDRDYVVSYYYEDRSLREIVDSRRVPETATRSTLHRARGHQRRPGPQRLRDPLDVEAVGQ